MQGIGSLLFPPSLQLYTSLFGFYESIVGLTHYVDGLIDSFNRILAEFMQHTDIFYPFQIPNLEVWFQRPKDIVRKLQSGDLDLGIVGFDIVSEYGEVRF